MTSTLRESWRALRRHPVSSLVAVLILACGIGANAVVFGALRAAVLTPPPVADPGRLLSLTEVERLHPQRPFGVSFPAYRDWQEGLGELARLAAYVPAEYVVSGFGEPARVQLALVSGSFFEVAGVRAALGRVFGAADDQPGAASVVVASHAFWRSQLGGQEGRVGTSLSLGGHPVTLVGVLPAGFDFPERAALYVPLERYRADRWANERRAHVLAVLARLAPQATREAVAGRLLTLQRAVEDQDPGHLTSVRTLQQALSGDLGRPLALLQAAAAFLLAVACVNLAGVLLSRGESRAGEWAVRRALGAGPAEIVRLALGESLLLAVLGAAAGLLLAGWAAPLVGSVVPDPRLASLQVDRRVVGLGALVAIVAGLVFGAVPALRALRVKASGPVVAASARLTSDRAAQRWLAGLLAGQVALALALLLGSGLLLVSLRRVLGTDPGFRPDSLLTLRVAPPPQRYDEPRDVVRFFRDAAGRVRALPGVEDVGAVSVLPLSGPGAKGEVSVMGRETPPEQRPSAGFLRVLPGYFRVAALPLLKGRDFDETDDASGEFVVIVTEGLARRLWPGEDPLGQRIKVGPPEGEPWLRVVGVVADWRQSGLDAAPEYQTFEPLAQRPRAVMRLAVRTAASPESLVRPVTAALRTLEPDAVLDQIATMDARVADSLRPRRLQAALLGVFALLACGIAALGIYGAVAYALVRRAREVAVRVALGATPRAVLGFVLRQGLIPVGIGLALGWPLAIGFAASLRSMLYGTGPLDLSVHFFAVALLAGVAALASLGPVWRALRVSPAEVLHQD